MNNISDYLKPATVYIVGNSIRVWFSSIDERLTSISLRGYLRRKGFSCSIIDETLNILEISISLCLDEKVFIPDLIEYIESFLGEGSVIDRTRTTIKKENKHMNR